MWWTSTTVSYTHLEGESLPYIGGTALPHGVVMGSFSKTVTPGFRMGYLLTKDHDLLRALNTAKEAADLHTNVFAQFVVLDYLRHNDLDEHLVKIRELYRTQARAMTDAMAEFFPAEVSFTKPQGGMFLWATLPEGLNTMDLFPKALERNVAFVPGEPFYAQPGAYSTCLLYTSKYFRFHQKRKTCRPPRLIFLLISMDYTTVFCAI